MGRRIGRPTLKLWDADHGNCLATFVGDATFECVALAGNTVAAGDTTGRLHLFDLRSPPLSPS